MRNSIIGTANITNSKKKLAANSDKRKSRAVYVARAAGGGWRAAGGRVPTFGLTNDGAL